MKITIQDLRPNPFRDLARYPIHREKIEALKASIRATGFWDNLVVRKAPDNGHYEVAFGHHRLQALQELVGEKVIEAGMEVEIPVRKLDDGAMIKIMANENNEVFKATSDVIDETVRIAREYLHTTNKTPIGEITASDISQFLGGGWNEDRVAVSLQRLGLFDRGTIKREQLKGLSHTAARSIQREVAKVEKTMLRNGTEKLGQDEDVTEQERKALRAQVQKAAGHVAQVLAEHIRGGGTTSDFKEKSLHAQAEMIPPEAPPEDRKLSTIDSAAQAVSAREFQRKVELLLRYRAYMSHEAKNDVAAKLKTLSEWCKEMLAQLEA